jgi:hypothetical protein
MSKHSASGAPAWSAMNAAPDVPPAGPDSTVQEAWLAAVPASIRPPFDCMIAGSGSPAAPARSTSRPR